MLNAFRTAHPKEPSTWFHIRWTPLVLTAVTALLLLWPAYINGGPFWFPDTSTYVRSADAATVMLTGSPSEWSDRLRLGDRGQIANSASSTLVSEQRVQLKPTRPVLAGRSIYYGFLIYLPMRYFGPWGGIFLQALLVAAILLYCLSITARENRERLSFVALIAFGAFIFFTPLPFYTSMLMPDVYSGLIVLTLSTLIVFWDKLSGAERASLILASGVMASFHSTNLLLTIALGTFGAILYLRRRLGWRPLLITAPVFALGALGGIAFSLAIAHSLHTTPISPPFLSARITAAGPGAAFLQKECAQDSREWALCPDRSKLPVESDSFLWSEDPRTGVFQLASPERQRRLSREDMRFFVAVVRQNPWGVVKVSIASAWKELTTFDLMNFNYPTEKVEELFTKYPPSIAHSIASSRAAQRTMPTSVVVFTSVAITFASLVLLAWSLVKAARHRLRITTEEFNFAVLLLLGVLANAAICGSLSGPHARYQMRLIWLVPLAASIAVGAAIRSTPKRSARDTRE